MNETLIVPNETFMVPTETLVVPNETAVQPILINSSEIKNTSSGTLDKSTSNNVMICGDVLTGKTTFMINWLNEKKIDKQKIMMVVSRDIIRDDILIKMQKDKNEIVDKTNLKSLNDLKNQLLKLCDSQCNVEDVTTLTCLNIIKTKNIYTQIDKFDVLAIDDFDEFKYNQQKLLIELAKKVGCKIILTTKNENTPFNEINFEKIMLSNKLRTFPEQKYFIGNIDELCIKIMFEIKCFKHDHSKLAIISINDNYDYIADFIKIINKLFVDNNVDKRVNLYIYNDVVGKEFEKIIIINCHVNNKFDDHNVFIKKFNYVLTRSKSESLVCLDSDKMYLNIFKGVKTINLTDHNVNLKEEKYKIENIVKQIDEETFKHLYEKIKFKENKIKITCKIENKNELEKIFDEVFMMYLFKYYFEYYYGIFNLKKYFENEDDNGNLRISKYIKKIKLSNKIDWNIFKICLTKINCDNDVKIKYKNNFYELKSMILTIKNYASITKEKLTFNKKTTHPNLLISSNIDIIKNKHKIISIVYKDGVDKHDIMKSFLNFHILNNKWSSYEFDGEYNSFEIWNIKTETNHVFTFNPKYTNLEISHGLAKLLSIKLENIILVYDLETTGLNVNKCDIIERYFHELSHDVEFSSGVIRTNNVPKKILDLTGITREEIKNGEDISLFKNQMFELLKTCKDPIIIAHNGTVFDHPIMRRYGIMTNNCKYYDSRMLIRQLSDKKLKNETLGEMYKVIMEHEYNGKAHRARADVMMVLELFEKIGIDEEMLISLIK